MADTHPVTPVASPDAAAKDPLAVEPQSLDDCADELFADTFDSMNIGKEDDEGSVEYKVRVCVASTDRVRVSVIVRTKD
jgi:hypothetical protein